MAFTMGSMRKTCGMGRDIRKDKSENTRVGHTLVPRLLCKKSIKKGIFHIEDGVVPKFRS